MAPSSESQQPEFGCDRWPLHFACRIGNLDHVKYLVEVMKMPLNEPDNYDATPLYLAALTGRDDICRFLLEKGAKCDPESGGDAARVFYVALTPKLRTMLREWSLTAASRDPYLDMLRKSYNDPTISDCVAVFGSERMFLHCVVIQARCPTMAEFIEEDDDIAELRLPENHVENAAVMSSLLEYLYTGILEIRDLETALITAEMALYYNLELLFDRLGAAIERHQSYRSLGSANKQFRCEVVEPSLLREDMMNLAQSVSTPTTTKNLWSDATLQCNQHTFSLHSLFLCSQSEYFHCALLGSFREAKQKHLDLSELIPSPSAIQSAIQWLYADAFSHPPSVQTAVSILEMGTAILCPRLCAHVANTVLIPAVDAENVFEMLSLSKMHALEKLEDKSVQVLACSLEGLAERSELRSLFREEAAETDQRGDVRVTDVPIAAEIRSAIMKGCEEGEVRSKRLDLLRRVVQRSLVEVVE